MNLPESIETIRSAGRMASNSRLSTRIDAPAAGEVRRFDVVERERSATAVRVRHVRYSLGRFRLERPQFREDIRRGQRGITHHAQVDGPVGAERGVLDVDLHHGGPVRDQVPVPHGPHVQGAAPADDQVGALDQPGGQR